MNEIQARRQEAMSAYEAYYARDLVSDEPAKFSALQAVMLAEIALQLAKQNEHLEFIARAVDNSETFERIANWLHAIADK